MPNNEALMLVAYGPPGSGKSCASVAAAPTGLFIGERAAVRTPAMSVLGVEIPDSRIVVPNGLIPIAEFLEGGKPLATVDGGSVTLDQVPAVVADDFSLIAHQEFQILEKRLKGFDLFRAFKQCIMRLRSAARRSGRHVLVNAHLGVPHVNELSKRLILGGPKLPGQGQEELPEAFDTVVRVVHCPWWPLGWTSLAACGQYAVPGEDHPYYEWVTKDRLNVFSGLMPLNFGEALRHRGYPLVLPAGLEWIDEVAETIATGMSGISEASWSYADALKRDAWVPISAATQPLRGRRDPRHVNWAVQNGVARAMYRRHELNAIERMYSPPPAPPAPPAATPQK